MLVIFLRIKITNLVKEWPFMNTSIIQIWTADHTKAHFLCKQEMQDAILPRRENKHRHIGCFNSHGKSCELLLFFTNHQPHDKALEVLLDYTDNYHCTQVYFLFLCQGPCFFLNYADILINHLWRLLSSSPTNSCSLAPAEYMLLAISFLVYQVRLNHSHVVPVFV